MSANKRRYWLAGNREPEQDVFFVEALDPALWAEGDADEWDTCWHTGMPAPEVFERLDGFKSINHIPGNNCLTVKNYLFETLAAASGRNAGQPGGERMGFFPRVYAMPEDYAELNRTAVTHPEKRWILKPKNSSRGRGIEVLRDVAAAPLDRQWLVQEYIDRPHLMNARKYVLRLYVLVTSVEPLRVYFYREGFAKLASEPYDPTDPSNRFSNLTNPDINAENQDVAAPVVFVALSDYRKWLRTEGHDDEALFQRIRDFLRLTLIAARDRMRARLGAVKADTTGCYELLGVDCLVDADLKPWILECNLSPSLEVCAAPGDGGALERRIKQKLVADLVSLIGLNREPLDFDGAAPGERIRRAAEDEIAHAGDFERIFPCAEAEDYLRFFPVPRYADNVLSETVTGRPAPRVHLAANRSIELVSDDELAIYSELTGTLYAPNPSASWIWMKTLDGASPDEIANEIIISQAETQGGISSVDEWKIRENIWDVAADWAGLGLIRRGAGTDAAIGDRFADAAEWAESDHLRVCGKTVELKYGCPAAAARLRTVFQPASPRSAADLTIAIQRAPVGYAVAIGSRLVGAGLRLTQVAPLVRRSLFERAPASDREIAVDGALLPIGGGEAVIVVGSAGGGWDGVAACAASRLSSPTAGGALLDLNGEARVAPLGLPLRLDEADIDDIEATFGLRLTKQIHQWSPDGEGRMLPFAGAPAQTPGSEQYRVRAMIIPERRHESGAALRVISLHDMMRTLISACVGPQLRITCAAARRLADWLAGRSLFALDFSKIADGATALDRHFFRDNV